MARKRLLALIMVAALLLSGSAALAGGRARTPAIRAAGDRVVALQRTDSDWEGTWYWYVDNTYNATNLTGVTALGLLETYRDTKNDTYLVAAENAASFIMVHLGVGATGTKHFERCTAADVVFLYRLAQVTRNTAYSDRALMEWINLKAFWPTAATLDGLFRSINRPSTWDLAYFLEAAHLSGDTTWASDMAALIADSSDQFYYGDPGWYALNLAGSIRALVGCGFGGQYGTQIVSMLNALIALIDENNSINGYYQDTAYAILAFSAVGGAARQYANDLARFLAEEQDVLGGWIESSREYPEVDGEALRALASTVGTNVTVDGFQPGAIGEMMSTWKKPPDTPTTSVPF